jgi:hypothetical protein
MNRYRICALAPGTCYTIALVRFIDDNQAIDLMKASIGKANAMIPTDIGELVAYREGFSLDGMTTTRHELGRCPA